MIARTRNPRWRSTGWAGYAACAWALLFALPHVYWAVGGTTGLGGRPMTAALMAVNLVAIPLSLIAAGLALATVQSWGRAVPPWVLLVGAWVASALLTLRGGVGLIQTAFEPGAAPLLVRIFKPGFLVGGILFGVVAWPLSHARGPHVPDSITRPIHEGGRRRTPRSA